MSGSGVFAIDRGVFEHAVFKNEPYTEREAWIWLIAAAAWKPMRVRVGRALFGVKRGQLVYANRFVAEKWQWSEARVRRFYGRLQVEGMIDALATHDAMVITICKYDTYQFTGEHGKDPPDALATHWRRKEEELEESIGRDGKARARARPFVVSQEALSFADELARICGHDVAFLPPQWVSAGPGVRVQMMLNAGWQVAVMREAAKAAVARKQDGPPNSILYFEKIFARAHAPQLPLPVVKLVEQPMENGHVQASQSRPEPATDWRGSRDRFRTAHAKLAAAVNERAAENGAAMDQDAVRPGAADGHRRS